MDTTRKELLEENRGLRIKLEGQMIELASLCSGNAYLVEHNRNLEKQLEFLREEKDHQDYKNMQESLLLGPYKSGGITSLCACGSPKYHVYYGNEDSWKWIAITVISASAFFMAMAALL